MGPLLEVKNLRVQFDSDEGTVEAVKNVGFEIRKGEVLCIVGESGSGKSVTSLSLMGLLAKNARIADGEIRFSGENLLDLPDEKLRKLRGNRLSMIFQEPMTSLNPVLTVGRQLMEPIELHKGLEGKQAKQLCIEWLEKVGIPRPEKVFREYPGTLSGGMRQRIMIAMAMICSPDILIADEPTTALDVTIQAQILDLIEQLRLENDSSVLLITHDLGVVAETADRVVVMYNGEVVEQGNVFDIFANPQHDYTKHLLSSNPNISEEYSQQRKQNALASEQKRGEEASNISKESEAPPASAGEHIKPGKTYLSVQGLKKYYPTSASGLFGSKEVQYVKAVDDVSFQIYRGETLGLVGESGCGKSTLSRMLIGLEQASDGRIWCNGRDQSSLRGADLIQSRKELQIVFQDPYSSLNPRIRIGDAIEEALLVHGLKDKSARRARANELLTMVGIPEHMADRFPHEFSGGQRQRIVIARALSVNPELLICDEPVSALDVSIQMQILNLLKDLQKQLNLTILFIAHGLGAVKYISDRIIVMNKGKIVEAGTTEEIFTNPKDPYTRKLLDAYPIPDPTKRKRRSAVPAS